MLDHVIDERRCERGVVEYYPTFEIRQMTARLFLEKFRSQFEDTRGLSSLRWYLNHVMLLKLASPSARELITAHPLWKVHISNQFHIKHAINIL